MKITRNLWTFGTHYFNLEGLGSDSQPAGQVPWPRFYWFILTLLRRKKKNTGVGHNYFHRSPDPPFTITTTACLKHLWGYYTVLTMVYNTQRYWVSGPVQWLRLALSKGPNRVGVFPHLRRETDPVSETLCFFIIISKNPDDGQGPKTQYLCIFEGVSSYDWDADY
jgi:hypothetical protein